MTFAQAKSNKSWLFLQSNFIDIFKNLPKAQFFLYNLQRMTFFFKKIIALGNNNFETKYFICEPK